MYLSTAGNGRALSTSHEQSTDESVEGRSGIVTRRGVLKTAVWTAPTIAVIAGVPEAAHASPTSTNVFPVNGWATNTFSALNGANYRLRFHLDHLATDPDTSTLTVVVNAVTTTTRALASTTANSNSGTADPHNPDGRTGLTKVNPALTWTAGTITAVSFSASTSFSSTGGTYRSFQLDLTGTAAPTSATVTVFAGAVPLNVVNLTFT